MTLPVFLFFSSLSSAPRTVREGQPHRVCRHGTHAQPFFSFLHAVVYNPLSILSFVNLILRTKRASARASMDIFRKLSEKEKTQPPPPAIKKIQLCAVCSKRGATEHCCCEYCGHVFPAGSHKRRTASRNRELQAPPIFSQKFSQIVRSWPHLDAHSHYFPNCRRYWHHCCRRCFLGQATRSHNN